MQRIEIGRRSDRPRGLLAWLARVGRRSPSDGEAARGSCHERPGECGRESDPSPGSRIEDERFPWPDDPDEVPAWRLTQERTARDAGFVLPAIRTRRDYEIAIAACEAQFVRESESAPRRADVQPDEPFEPLQIVTMDGAPVGRSVLPPEIAARKFQAWLLETGRIGKWSSDEMRRFYVAHCSAEKISPTPENVLREALKRLNGVSRVNDDVRIKGKRKRAVVWCIEGSPPMKVRRPVITSERRAIAC